MQNNVSKKRRSENSENREIYRHNTVKSNTIKDTKRIEKNFIDKKINQLRRKKNNKVAITIVDFYDFYKKNIQKKHSIIYIISIVLFALMLVYYFSNINSEGAIGELLQEEIQATNLLGKSANFKAIFKDKMLVNAIVLISGITPYIYIPVLGIMFSNTLAVDVVCLSNNIASNMNSVFMIVGAVIQLFGISLTSAVGMLYCKLTTKRFRYSQKVNFTINDLKKEYYAIRKDDEKLDEVIKKDEKRKEEIEKLNVKIPYKNIIIAFVISSAIIIFGGLIALI